MSSKKKITKKNQKKIILEKDNTDDDSLDLKNSLLPFDHLPVNSNPKNTRQILPPEEKEVPALTYLKDKLKEFTSLEVDNIESKKIICSLIKQIKDSEHAYEGKKILILSKKTSMDDITLFDAVHDLSSLTQSLIVENIKAKETRRLFENSAEEKLDKILLEVRRLEEHVTILQKEKTIQISEYTLLKETSHQQLRDANLQIMQQQHELHHLKTNQTSLITRLRDAEHIIENLLPKLKLDHAKELKAVIREKNLEIRKMSRSLTDKDRDSELKSLQYWKDKALKFENLLIMRDSSNALFPTNSFPSRPRPSSSPSKLRSSTSSSTETTPPTPTAASNPNPSNTSVSSSTTPTNAAPPPPLSLTSSSSSTSSFPQGSSPLRGKIKPNTVGQPIIQNNQNLNTNTNNNDNNNKGGSNNNIDDIKHHSDPTATTPPDTHTPSSPIPNHIPVFFRTRPPSAAVLSPDPNSIAPSPESPTQLSISTQSKQRERPSSAPSHLSSSSSSSSHSRSAIIPHAPNPTSSKVLTAYKTLNSELEKKVHHLTTELALARAFPLLNSTRLVPQTSNQNQGSFSSSFHSFTSSSTELDHSSSRLDSSQLGPDSQFQYPPSDSKSGVCSGDDFDGLRLSDGRGGEPGEKSRERNSPKARAKETSSSILSSTASGKLTHHPISLSKTERRDRDKDSIKQRYEFGPSSSGIGFGVGRKEDSSQTHQSRPDSKTPFKPPVIKFQAREGKGGHGEHGNLNQLPFSSSNIPSRVTYPQTLPNNQPLNPAELVLGDRQQPSPINEEDDDDDLHLEAIAVENIAFSEFSESLSNNLNNNRVLRKRAPSTIDIKFDLLVGETKDQYQRFQKLKNAIKQQNTLTTLKIKESDNLPIGVDGRVDFKAIFGHAEVLET